MRYAVAVIVVEIGCVAMAVVGQDTADSLSGHAGWVGTGLLGAVLAWLLFIHLPNKDKQTIQLMEAKDKQFAEMLASFTIAQSASQASFSSRNDKTLETFSQLTREERTNYQKWHEENRAILERMVAEIKDSRSSLLSEMKDQRHALANLRHELGLKEAVKKLPGGEGRVYGPAREEGDQ